VMKISAEAMARMVATRKARGNYIQSEDVRRKISESLKGRKKPPRTKAHAAKIAMALKDRKLSPEHRARSAEVLREAHKSEKWLAATRAYAESRRGIPRKPETIMKMSATAKAMKRTNPPHVRAIIGMVSRNRVRTIEERMKIAKSLRGRKRDPEIGRKVSATMLARRTKPYPGKRQKDPRYYPWRRAVMKRDGFACKMCGVVNKGNHAHHLKGWSEAPELRYEVENAITLCVSCHAAHHHEERRKERG
jgi:hypothetical protein